jgi:hypothetical protein
MWIMYCTPIVTGADLPSVSTCFLPESNGPSDKPPSRRVDPAAKVDQKLV